MKVISMFLTRTFGDSESLCCCDTLQFEDYSQYVAPRFNPELKAKRRQDCSLRLAIKRSSWDSDRRRDESPGCVSKPGTTVQLRAQESGDKVTIEVEDECGGLPPGRIEELFRPFTQGGADRSGVGLGLTISRRAIELNGGSLSARDLPGKGCVFTIILPKTAVHERPAASSAGDSLPPTQPSDL